MVKIRFARLALTVACLSTSFLAAMQEETKSTSQRSQSGILGRISPQRIKHALAKALPNLSLSHTQSDFRAIHEDPADEKKAW